MSVAINRGILFKDRTTPAETVESGEAYFWYDGASLKYKDDTQTTHTITAGISAEDVQDIVGAFITSGNTKLTAVYNDAGNSFVITVVESNIVHQNLSGAGTNTHTQIDSHLSSTSNPHGTTAAQVGAEPTGTAAAAVAAHAAASDPHPGYLTPSEGNAAYDAIGAASTAQSYAVQRANHTGTQTSSTISDFAATTRSTVLTGFSVGANASVAASDTVLGAFGKIQGQINAFASVSTWTETLMTTDVPTTSNTTLTSLTELGFSVVSGSKYYFNFILRYQSTVSTTGIVIGLNSTDGAAGSILAAANAVNAADGVSSFFNGNLNSLGDVMISTNVAAINIDLVAQMQGIFTCTTSGTIVPQFRCEVTGATLTVYAGSVSLVRRFS